jgi:hypothetical protein
MPDLHLLVGIDTEGDNQWDVRAREKQTFENIYRLSRLHDLFVRRGVRPTYLVTYPVATDTRSVEILRGLVAGGGCEIGAHHHAWETPPCQPEDVRRHPYALSLPIEQFEDQLTQLTAAIAVAAGERPVSYRSGRFGFSASHVFSLERAGYRVESSVAPLFFEGHKGGPDFVGAPLRPYFLAYDDPTVPGSSDLLEVPVSAALNRRLPEPLQRMYGHAPSPYLTRRLLRATRIAKMIWLRPSYSSLDDMIALARRLQADRVPVLNVLFHSSEVLAGGSPYNRTDDEVDAFLGRLDRFLEFAVAGLGAVPATFAEFREAFCACRLRPNHAAVPVARGRGSHAARR